MQELPVKSFAALSTELGFAIDICEQAAKLAMAHFTAGIEAVMKDDGSPVTAADKECEHLIRTAIQSKFPDDLILGEEEGASPGASHLVPEQSRRKWIIDPIDGTYGYARGIPVFSTLLALEQAGEIILGVVCAPALDHLYWAEKGKGAFRNGQPIHVSDKVDLADSQLSFGGINRIHALGYWPGFTKLVTSTCRQRGFGDYLGFASVFEGKAEAHIEVGVKPWDLAPMKIITEEAGGIFTDLNGSGSIYSGNCVTSNGRNHDQWLQTLTVSSS